MIEQTPHNRVVSNVFHGQRPEDVRRSNRAVALELLRVKARSRSDLARTMHLSKPALGDLIGDLLLRGVVVERAPTPTLRGRHPAPLEINDQRFSVIGMDVACGGAEIGLFDALGQALEVERVALPNGMGAEAVYAVLLKTLRAFRTRCAKRHAAPMAALGITSPGPIDARTGTVLNPPNFADLNGLALAPRLEHDLGLTVRLERDAAAAATAYLNQTDLQHFVYILLTKGIGASIVVGRQVLRGEHGFAGEFGHVSVDQHGAPCACGNRGCVEGLASSRAIETAFGGGHTVLEIAQLARDGDGAARTVFEAAGRALGLACVSLVNLLDPTALVLGGPGAAWAELLLPAMRAQLEERAYPFLNWGAQLPVLIAPAQPLVCLEAAECVLKAVQLGEIPLPDHSLAVPQEVALIPAHG